MRWAMIISTISWGSLTAGDEGIAGVSGEALAERILLILARLRNQTCLANSSIAVVVNNRTRLSIRTLGSQRQDYLTVKTSGSSSSTSLLFRWSNVSRRAALHHDGTKLFGVVCLRPSSYPPRRVCRLAGTRGGHASVGERDATV